ncbi:MAG: hypothetical protein J7L59_00660 [Nanoarchaeota archaeon]|nr:hypothetical protein [Nanoarchaeota archaeon]
MKDVPWEGFKIKKFVRSPVASILGSLLLAYSSPGDTTYLFLAVPGIERIFVECYKTFLKRRVRGIFEGRKPKFTEWFSRRKIFEFLFYCLVALAFTFLLI